MTLTSKWNRLNQTDFAWLFLQPLIGLGSRRMDHSDLFAGQDPAGAPRRINAVLAACSLANVDALLLTGGVDFSIIF